VWRTRTPNGGRCTFSVANFRDGPEKYEYEKLLFSICTVDFYSISFFKLTLSWPSYFRNENVTVVHCCNLSSIFIHLSLDAKIS
jgi:hypothetical protein